MKKISAFIIALMVVVSPALAEPQGLYAYETSEGMMAGAVFGNFPDDVAGDVLVSASAPICDHVEIHEMSEADGVMKMRQVDSIPVEEGQGLSPHGYHLMLIKPMKPLSEGESFPLTLHFKEAGEKVLSIPVLSRKAK